MFFVVVSLVRRNFYKISHLSLFVNNFFKFFIFSFLSFHSVSFWQVTLRSSYRSFATALLGYHLTLNLSSTFFNFFIFLKSVQKRLLPLAFFILKMPVAHSQQAQSYHFHFCLSSIILHYIGYCIQNHFQEEIALVHRLQNRTLINHSH